MNATDALAAVKQASQDGKVSATAVENIQCWLTEDRYCQYRDQVADEVAAENWQALDDAFWTIIPFGTGGRRGRMYPIGSNAINDRTIGESAQGLADYVVEFHQGRKELSCVIAYDTRHKSRHFRRTLRRNHGCRRNQSLFSGRLSRDTATFVRRATQTM